MDLRELEIYKLRLELSGDVWSIYKSLPKDLKYNIGNQVLSSVDSIGANIAEGYGRYHYKDSMRFYYNARGSLWESKHWILLLYNRNLITSDSYNILSEKLELLGKKLNFFIKKIKGIDNVAQ